MLAASQVSSTLPSERDTTPATTRTAGQVAIQNVIIRDIIVESLLPAGYPYLPLPQRTKHDLAMMMSSSHDLFDSAVRHLWSRIDNINVLFAVLKPDGNNRALRTASGSVALRSFIMEKYATPESAMADPLFAHFLGYAQWIRFLCTSTTLVPHQFARFLSGLIPSGQLLFPRLKDLYWIDRHILYMDGDIPHPPPQGQFHLLCDSFRLLQGPAISSLSFCLPNTIHRFENWATAALVLVCNCDYERPPNVHFMCTYPTTRYDISSLSELVQRNLFRIFEVELVDSEVPHRLVASARGAARQRQRSVEQIAALGKSWDENAGSVCSISIPANPVRKLVLGSNTLPLAALHHQRYIAHNMVFYIQKVEIFIAVNSVLTTSIGRSRASILEVILPLLQITRLRSVNIEIKGVSFSFSTEDFYALVQAWQELRNFNLLCSLYTQDNAPDLESIYRLLATSTSLQSIHIPLIRCQSTQSVALDFQRPPTLLWQLTSTKLVTDHIQFDPDDVSDIIISFFPYIGFLTHPQWPYDQAWDAISQALDGAKHRRNIALHEV
ncbi:hypothetical protein C8Q78DRAFT_1080618 [Trametes maxima]|nr:hypothetical protein C8Q78DRAFT_1080618 [Trametes maxima]